MLQGHKKRRYENALVIFMITLFVVLIIYSSIIISMNGEKHFLENERRSTLLFKDIKVDIKDGKITDDLETYLKEQFVCRDHLIKIKSFIENILKINFSNNVYICDGQYFIENENKIDPNFLYEKISNYEKVLEDVKCDFDFFMFPNAYYIYNELLPEYAEPSQYEYFSYLLNNTFNGTKFKFHDMADDIKALKEDNNYNIYYKTDHHMTSDALYNISSKVFNKMKLRDTNTANAYQKTTVTDAFQGSLMSKSARFINVYDNIDLYIPKKTTRYVLTDYGENKRLASIYDPSKIDSYDPYLVFLGGNSGHINIRTENYTEKKILVLKDSYFNAFLPFMIDKYREIDIIDPRYIDKEINELVNLDSYDNIMFFMNFNTFNTK